MNFIIIDDEQLARTLLDNFLEKNTSELVEYWPAESIWEQIEDLALSVNEYKK